eukprot:CAMPEP_0194492068 /NCGR_PEP_ID=MMETSP0253-20130528/10750_1 /TAXON_ID=2966 /ORGANISM="Noctiluca scintillans" /LENGTH=752 /DNA_ID=CAMNT_0039332885 /DNA_START=51 /DNA_END=2309 /DNA_ORIENTATION=-
MLLSWGANQCGQCCTDDDASDHRGCLVWPRLTTVASISSRLGIQISIASISIGEAHTLLLSDYGDVFACGRNREGQLGLDGGPDVHQVSIVEALRPWHIARVACGTKHSVAVSRDGRSFEWGSLLPLTGTDEEVMYRRKGLGRDFEEDLNEKQRRIVAESWSQFITNGTAIEENDGGLKALEDHERRRTSVRSPRECPGLDGLLIVGVACGFAHSVLCTNSGVLYSAGYNEKGQLGNGSRQPSPTFSRVELPGVCRINGGQGTATLACGLNHNAAVLEEGELVTWGMGTFGQLGLGHGRKEARVPGTVDIGAVQQVACGDHHVLAYTWSGELFCFGHRDAVGGNSHFERMPQLNRNFQNATIERLYAGGMGSFVTTSKSASLCSWGYNQRFQIGRGAQDLEPLKPYPTLSPIAGMNLQSFFAGSYTCVAAMDLPKTPVLPAGVQNTSGNALLLAAFRNSATWNVTVTARDNSRQLGAHSSVLRARCPSLASRLKPGRGDNSWDLELLNYSSKAVAALLEYLYCDYCEADIGVASELRPLAKEFNLAHLGSGVEVSTVTKSADEEIEWVRGPNGQWVSKAIQEMSGSWAKEVADSVSTYASDIASLVADGAEKHPDFVDLAIQQLDGHVQRVLVARPLLQCLDFFRAMLEDGFANVVDASGAIIVSAENAAALASCLHLLVSDARVPEDTLGALALLVEAHRCCLFDIVHRVQSILIDLLDGADAVLLKELTYAAELYGLSKLATQVRSSSPA